MKKSNFRLSIFFLSIFLTSYSIASGYSTRTLLDKTFVHDNTYCNVGGKKLEIEIRSYDKYTISGDEEYGEHVFLIQDEKYIHLPLNESKIGRFKLLKGKDANCTKALSLKINDKELVLFFLKDNRPLLNTLTVLTYNTSTRKSKINETSFGIINAKVDKTSLVFSTSTAPDSNEVGQVNIRNKNFIYMRKNLNTWFKFTKEEFLLEPEITYSHFEHKRFFAGKEEFFHTFMLNFDGKKFEKDSYTYAIHHPTKEECFSLNFSSGTLNKTRWVCKSSINKDQERKPLEKFDLALLQE